MTRYFKTDAAFWRFSYEGQPQIRTEISGSWMDSVFASLSEFLSACEEEALEISADEAERFHPALE